ncbi:MAG: RdgB/HAM1 family non-canonical purine NTP pyrophosphatase [Flavobacteriia bacterium]|nr:RdgB/HAM1 family non-canonical purine NTP pyrophosphatase [Flavobacteriia bacterium]
MEKIYFISSNNKKIEEIKKMFPSDIILLSLKDLNWQDEIAEDHETFVENATQKVEVVLSKHSNNAFADDSGLEVEALNGAPGVYSARFAQKNDSLMDNVDFLLQKLRNKTNRKAQFVCCIVLFWKGKYYSFEGKIKGQISLEKKGDFGFAYDCVFVPDGYSQTFAEMNSTQKNTISHRFIAINKMLDFLNQNQINIKNDDKDT